MTTNADEIILDIPFGDFDYLIRQDIETLPRAQLRRHLAARSLDDEGTRLELSNRLQESLDEENREKQRLKEEYERRFREMAALEEQGAVYVCGRNDKGQLGLGDFIGRKTFTVIPFTRGLFIERVVTTNNITFAVSKSKTVYSWGSTCLDAVLKEPLFATPYLIESLNEEDIRQVAVGATFAIGLNEHGDIYTWGIQARFESDISLGTPDLELTCVQKNIQSLSSGKRHWCAIDSVERLYTCGHSGLGPHGTVSWIPRLLPISEKIRLVACGAEHTLCSSGNRTFAFGDNDGGRLGLGDKEQKNEICEIESLRGVEILDLSAGTWHSACIGVMPPLHNCGFLYTWGSGYAGQLAQGDTMISLVPTIVPFFARGEVYAKKIFCGSHHNAVISKDGKMFTWGLNEQGCLGRKIRDERNEFVSKPGLVEGFGSKVDGIGRGIPKSIALGKGYTIVCTMNYNEPPEST
jgi:hypothetical protein